jgi:hypothetical protein
MGKAKEIISRFEDDKELSENLNLDSKKASEVKTLLMWISSGAKKDAVEDLARRLYKEIFG